MCAMRRHSCAISKASFDVCKLLKIWCQGRNRTADASLFRAAASRNPLKSQGTDGSSSYAKGPLDTVIEPLSNPRVVGTL